MRIAIVNDLPMAVEAMRRVLAQDPKHQVAWVAFDGREAVASCARDKPDLILMDLIMPGMDGLEATRRIMAESVTVIVGEKALHMLGRTFGQGNRHLLSPNFALATARSISVLHRGHSRSAIGGELVVQCPRDVV